MPASTTRAWSRGRRPPLACRAKMDMENGQQEIIMRTIAFLDQHALLVPRDDNSAMRPLQHRASKNPLALSHNMVEGKAGSGIYLSASWSANRRRHVEASCSQGIAPVPKPPALLHVSEYESM